MGFKDKRGIGFTVSLTDLFMQTLPGTMPNV
jgi:hypothetical protein